MLDMAENSGNSQEHDVDAILAQAYGQENPVEKSAPAAEVKQAPPSEPQLKEFEFNARGQAIKIKENDPRLSQWLSQGHDYAQNVAQMKAEREQWEKSRTDWEKTWTPYREIDQFAQQNPDWWQHIEQSYRERLSTPAQVPDPVRQYLDQRLSSIEKNMPLVQDYLHKQEVAAAEKRASEEDAKLSSAMKSIQEKYKDLDFTAKDESGLSLERRVLNHAVENGFPTFRAAFLDYYHDSLEKQAEARGKEAIMQEMNKRKKLGLLDEPAPTSRAPISSARKPASWSDPSLSSDQILKEMNFR